MARNNAALAAFNQLQRQIKHITPQVYAGIALALHREFGWGFVRINRLFQASQAIWMECNDRDIDMVDMCAQEIGIELRHEMEPEPEREASLMEHLRNRRKRRNGRR